MTNYPKLIKAMTALASQTRNPIPDQISISVNTDNTLL